jgi:hypothetical protein
MWIEVWRGDEQGGPHWASVLAGPDDRGNASGTVGDQYRRFFVGGNGLVQRDYTIFGYEWWAWWVRRPLVIGVRVSPALLPMLRERDAPSGDEKMPSHPPIVERLSAAGVTGRSNVAA